MEKCDDPASELEILLAADRRFSRAGSLDNIQRYPTAADIAGTKDLGFTAGSWVSEAATGGAALHGDYLTVWKHDSAGAWQVQFDGKVSHAGPAQSQPGAPFPAGCAAEYPPPQDLVARDAAGKSVRDFQDACSDDGFPAALRTYARTADFRLLKDGEPALDLAAAIRLLSSHAVKRVWQENGCGRSADSSLVYAGGVLAGGRQQNPSAYAQIWQYSSKVANWGLRILFIDGTWPNRFPNDTANATLPALRP